MDGTLDMSMQLAMLQSQKQTLEAAKARKGQKPSSKATRMELAMEFSIMVGPLPSLGINEHH